MMEKMFWRATVIIWLVLGGSMLAAVPVKFEIRDGGAQRMAVVGEFNQWGAQEMQKGESGLWTVELLLEPGSYGYKFLRDGEVWLMDPSNSRVKDVDGARNSLLVVKSVDEGPREWTQQKTGNKLTGTILSYDGSVVRVKTDDGRELKLPTEMLAEDDRAYAEAWKKQQPPVESAGAAAGTTGGSGTWRERLQPGGEPVRWRFDVPVFPKATRYGSFPEHEKAPIQVEVRVSIPDAFDPNAEGGNWIGVVSATASGNSKSCDAMDMYWRHCTKSGMVCVAADIVAEGDDMRTWANVAVRWQLFYMALEQMEKEWGKIRTWTYVPMGYSGGGGYSFYFAEVMDNLKWDVGGVLLNASGYTGGMFKDKVRAKSKFYRNVPVYMSFGEKDDVVKAGLRDDATSWGERSMKHFKTELFDGGHEVYPEHVDNALLWFRTVRSEQKQGDKESSE